LRHGAKVVRIEDGETGLSARTIKRRLATIAGLDEYLIIRGDCDVTRNPVPRGLAMRRPGQRPVQPAPHRAAGHDGPVPAQRRRRDRPRHRAHQMRRTLATQAISRGMSLDALAALLDTKPSP